MQIAVDDLEISYGALRAVGPVSLRAEHGQQLTLLGPSGCGKTTTLRAVAGLERPSAGRITIGDRLVYDGGAGLNVPAERRGLSMVFQSYAIWPHMTVAENVAYGLRVRRVASADIRDKVRTALDLVQMAAYAERPASQLSGGQQQRVALARACAFQPSVLLFDEPLSNLDAKLRGDMRIELRELQHRLGVTSLYVTHDLEEALAMSDQIVVMRAGHIEQIGSPADIYHYPRTEFVADFVGSANLVAGTLRPDLAEAGLIALEPSPGTILHAVAHGRQPGPVPTVSIRTVHCHLTPGDAAESRNVWPVTIERTIFLGDMTQAHINWAGRELVVRHTSLPFAPGQPATLSIDPAHCVLLEAG